MNNAKQLQYQCWDLLDCSLDRRLGPGGLLLVGPPTQRRLLHLPLLSRALLLKQRLQRLFQSASPTLNLLNSICAHPARLPAALLLSFLLLLLLPLPLQPALFHQLLGPLHPRLQLLPC